MLINLGDTFQKLLYSISTAFGVPHSIFLKDPPSLSSVKPDYSYFTPNFPIARHLPMAH